MHINTFWVPTTGKPGQTEDHTSLQTQILKKMNEFKKNEKLNATDSIESRKKPWATYSDLATAHASWKISRREYTGWILRHFCQTYEVIWDEHEVEVKLISNDDRVVYSHNLTMPIHLKEHLIVELALMHKYEISIVLRFSKYESRNFAERKANRKLRLLVDLGKINTLLVDGHTNKCHPVSALWDAAQQLAGKSVLYKFFCFKRITVCGWPTRSQWTCLHSILVADLLLTEDLHKISADVRLLSQTSRAITWTQHFNWPICSKRGRYWDSSQQCYGSYPEYSGSLQVYSQNRIEIDKKKCHFGVRQVEIPGRIISIEKIQRDLKKLITSSANSGSPIRKKHCNAISDSGIISNKSF